MKRKKYILITENGNSRQSFSTRTEVKRKGRNKKGAKIISYPL